MSDPHASTDSAAPQVGSAADSAAGAAAVPHAGARYAVLRLALLVTVGGLLYLVGMRGWALLFAAVLTSGVLSFFVFLRQREAAARSLEERLHASRRHRPAGDRPTAPETDPEPALEGTSGPRSPDPDAGLSADRREGPTPESHVGPDEDPPPPTG